MGWESRRGKSYYYQKIRVDGKVVSIYVGRGPQAEAIAAEDAQEQAARAAQRAELNELKETFAAQDRTLARLRDVIKTMTRAEMLLNGYHMHKGQWRKRRKQHGGTDNA